MGLVNHQDLQVLVQHVWSSMQAESDRWLQLDNILNNIEVEWQ